MSSRTIIVLGMGRSGTSAVADVLRRLGVYWGPENLMMAPQIDNPRGFWEFIPFYEINVELMRRLGGHWHRPPSLGAGWERSAELDDLRSKAIDIVQNCFRVPLWGFKDPRCCLTLPFWRTVIPNPIECVIPIRNPLEVAASLEHREKLPFSRGLGLWIAYVTWAWQASLTLRRIVVSYDRILADPGKEISRLEGFLRVDSSSSLLSNAISGIHQELRHERADLGEALSNPEVPEIAKELYRALQSLSRDEPADIGQFMGRAMEFSDSIASCSSS